MMYTKTAPLSEDVLTFDDDFMVFNDEEIQIEDKIDGRVDGDIEAKVDDRVEDKDMRWPGDQVNGEQHESALLTPNSLVSPSAWKIMIVDDEVEIHRMTQLALQKFAFLEKGLTFLSAYSGEEAKQLIANHPDTAIILLDVVMEASDSGLQVAKFVREELRNTNTRIVLSTGQPGEAPEESVILNYDINDYRTKPELTRQKLFTTIIAALRSYRDIVMIEAKQQELGNTNAQLQQEIIERKRTQEALTELNKTLDERVAQRTADLEKLTAELARSNQSLEQFAYIASHDLQEPLRKVQTFGNRLQSKYAHALDDRGHDYLERMQGATRRMQTLIRDLLDYSRVSTRARPFGEVALNQVIEEVLSDLETRVEEVEGQVHVAPLPTLMADRTQMRQLMQNLIGNALKFHRPNVPPVIHVEGQLVTTDERDPSIKIPAMIFAPNQPFYQITVQDNGLGIEEKYQERIFEVFQRLHRREQYEGTGIGLAICRKIVERHNGFIDVSSTPNQGTRFTIFLPIQEIEI